MIWTKIHEKSLKAAFFIGGLALGSWSTSIADQSAKLEWLHQQAAAVPKLKKSATEAYKKGFTHGELAGEQNIILDMAESAASPDAPKCKCQINQRSTPVKAP